MSSLSKSLRKVVKWIRPTGKLKSRHEDANDQDQDPDIDRSTSTGDSSSIDSDQRRSLPQIEVRPNEMAAIIEARLKEDSCRSALLKDICRQSEPEQFDQCFSHK